jgi:hypothetical protein
MAQNITARKFPSCKKDSCFINKEAHKAELTNNCLREYQQKLSQITDHPYFCDQLGNYIINKEHFIKGLYGVATIDN